MSLVLAIEISNPSAWSPEVPVRPGVAVGACAADDTLLYATSSIDPARTHDDGLMPIIDGLLRSMGRSPREVSRLAVSIGPGGFTAVRIAVTTAKLIAIATGARCYPVPSASVAAAAVTDAAGDILVVLATKGQSVYAARFSAGAQPRDAGQVVAAEDLSLDGVHTIVADRFAPAALLIRAAERNIRVLPPVFDPALLLKIHDRFPPCAPEELIPLYPREPEAVTKWRELKRLGKK